MVSTSTFLFLNSLDSVQPELPYDCRWILNWQLENTGKNYMTLEQMTFANTLPPVNSRNNVLEFTENSEASGTLSVIIPEGTYTGSGFATALKGLLDTASTQGNTYTVTFSSITKKLTIAASANDWRPLSSSTALRVIGISFQQTTSSVASLEGANTVRLDGPAFIDVISNFGTRNINSSGRSNILARIPLEAPFGSVQTYRCLSDARIRFFNSELDVVNISLIDDTGAIFRLQDNSEVSYVLRFSFS